LFIIFVLVLQFIFVQKLKTPDLMIVSNDSLNNLIAFRKYLHKFPELSKSEFKTAKKIKEFLLGNQPDEIIEGLGKTGLAAVYEGSKPGKTILIRADIDALPIGEINCFSHQSVVSGVSHKCGHDGHTAIVAGLSGILHSHPPKSGRVVLLFQPAEETGEGASMILKDPKFDSLKPDYVFAMHNLPGYDENSIVIRKETFAAASKGMIARLTGKTSHAASPENGISPALAVAEIIQQFDALSHKKEGFGDFKLLTLIYSRIGEIAFGTMPGYAEIMATLRSYQNDDMKLLSDSAVKIVEVAADKFGLHETIEWREEFPATVNDDFFVDLIAQVAHENKADIIQANKPFGWSEDFGYFTLNYPGAFFGIGAGKNHPSLHNPDYDFPDKIIIKALDMFDGIIRNILG